MALQTYRRTNHTVAFGRTLHVLLVATRLRQPAWRPLMCARLNSVQWAWRKRTLAQDCWATARMALRYRRIDNCKRRAPYGSIVGARTLSPEVLHRNVYGTPHTVHILWRAYRFKRFPSQRFALEQFKRNRGV